MSAKEIENVGLTRSMTNLNEPPLLVYVVSDVLAQAIIMKMGL